MPLYAVKAETALGKFKQMKILCDTFPKEERQNAVSTLLKQRKGIHISHHHHQFVNFKVNGECFKNS
jgi:hypothetical protein